MTNVNDEALQRLKAERAEAEADKWEKVGERKRKLLIRTSSIGAGMCLLIGLVFGGNILLLLFGSLLLAGGATALAVRFGLDSYGGGLFLGAVSTLVIFLSGGGSILVPLFTFPLGLAIFIGFRSESDL